MDTIKNMHFYSNYLAIKLLKGIYVFNFNIVTTQDPVSSTLL